MAAVSFKDITERTGDEVSQEQVQRLCDRYYWAADYVDGKDVIEVACGTGNGLGYLASRARSVQACDVSDETLAFTRAHYGSRIRINTADAGNLPYADASADVVMILEALYFLPDEDAFMREAKRILRPGGMLLVVTANKDLYDFNPSPYAHVYHAAEDLPAYMRQHGFEVIDMAGGTPLASVSLRQKILRPVKKMAVSLNLIPTSMAGKKLLKRLVFGKMVTIPPEIDANTCVYEKPVAITPGVPDHRHKIIFCAAKKI